MASPTRSLLLTLVLILTIAVAGAAAQTPVTIEVWDVLPQVGREVFEQLLREFQEEYPHITIESNYVTGGYHAIREKFVVGWASGVVPNVIQMGNAHTYDLRYMGVFAELDGFISQDPSFDLSDWYPPFREMTLLNGKTYGIPYNVSTPILYYSPFVFERSGLEPVPPKTWDEIITIGKRITRDETGDGQPDCTVKLLPLQLKGVRKRYANWHCQQGGEANGSRHQDRSSTTQCARIGRGSG